jgi:hypothetical protein
MHVNVSPVEPGALRRQVTDKARVDNALVDEAGNLDARAIGEVSYEPLVPDIGVDPPGRPRLHRVYDLGAVLGAPLDGDDLVA